MTRYRVALDPKTGKAYSYEVGESEQEELTNPGVEILNRPEVCIASSVLPRWEKNHAAAGGKFTKEGKPIMESRHQAMEFARRSQGESDVYWEYGDIDRLGH